MRTQCLESRVDCHERVLKIFFPYRQHMLRGCGSLPRAFIAKLFCIINLPLYTVTAESFES